MPFYRSQNGVVEESKKLIVLNGDELAASPMMNVKQCAGSEDLSTYLNGTGACLIPSVFLEAQNKDLSWPAGFIKSGAHVVESLDDLQQFLSLSQ